LAQCNEEGETPLTVAMKRKNIRVTKEMVTWMLDYQDHLSHKKECKSMPIFIIDQLSHHIPVLEAHRMYHRFRHAISGESLIGDWRFCDRKSWLELIDLVFLQSTSLTRQDKIIALELIGALAIIHCYESMTRFALKCWREAMTLRYFPQDGEPLLQGSIRLRLLLNDWLHHLRRRWLLNNNSCSLLFFFFAVDSNLTLL
jgi:hypothetical protein